MSIFFLHSITTITKEKTCQKCRVNLRMAKNVRSSNLKWSIDAKVIFYFRLRTPSKREFVAQINDAWAVIGCLIHVSIAYLHWRSLFKLQEEKKRVFWRLNTWYCNSFWNVLKKIYEEKEKKINSVGTKWNETNIPFLCNIAPSVHLLPCQLTDNKLDERM